MKLFNNQSDCLLLFQLQALHCAVEYNRIEIAKVLIEAGIDTLIRNNRGYTAKLLAQASNRTEIEALFPREDKNFLVPIDYKFYDTFQDLVPGIQGDSKMYVKIIFIYQNIV